MIPSRGRRSSLGAPKMLRRTTRSTGAAATPSWYQTFDGTGEEVQVRDPETEAPPGVFVVTVEMVPSFSARPKP